MAIRRDQAPDVTGLLRGYVSRFADAWAVAHRHDNPRAGEWIQKAVAALRAEHPAGARWVCNGKRGNPNDLSWDVVGYVVDEANGNPRMIECYDVIANAGRADQSIVWQNITNYETMGGDGTAIAVIPPPLTGEPEPTPGPDGIWTQRHQDVADALARLFLPSAAHAYAEQFAHTFAAEQWGRKRSGPGRPLSDDTIARRLPNGRLYGVRVVPTVHLWGVLDAAQEFEPVTAHDYLGAEPEPGPVDPPPVDPEPEPNDPPPADALVDEIVERVLAGLVPVLDDINARLDALGVATLQARDSADKAASQSYDVNGKAGWVGAVTGTITPKG